MSTSDFALVEREDDWLQHPILGDSSFDFFRRRPGNRICRGKSGLKLPVNGLLFEDTASGHWYVYTALPMQLRRRHESGPR